MKNKLKLGFLAFYHPHLGGSGILATRIATHLVEKGHEVHFIGYDTDSNPESLSKKGILLHKVKRIDYPTLKNEPYVWTLATKIVEIAKKHKLDLIHAHYALPHALSSMIAKEQLKEEGYSLPYIVTGHGSDIHTNGSKDEVNSILRLSLNRANAITYVSKDLKKIAEQTLGVTKKGEHITNFIDTNFFCPGETNLREKLNISKKAFIIGHASNFASIKQVYHFAKLAQQLKKRNQLRSVYFLMCGDGEDKKKLKKEVKKLGLEKSFIFLGKVNTQKMKAAYNAMDIFILPSKEEGCPLTILEAMSCGKPVIGTSVRGIKDIINQDCGFKFKVDDIKSLTDKVEILKKDKNLREEMGKNAREYAIKNHSVEKVMKKYYSLYKKVIKANK